MHGVVVQGARESWKLHRRRASTDVSRISYWRLLSLLKCCFNTCQNIKIHKLCHTRSLSRCAPLKGFHWSWRPKLRYPFSITFIHFYIWFFFKSLSGIGHISGGFLAFEEFRSCGDVWMTSQNSWMSSASRSPAFFLPALMGQYTYIYMICTRTYVYIYIYISWSKDMLQNNVYYACIYTYMIMCVCVYIYIIGQTILQTQ